MTVFNLLLIFVFSFVLVKATEILIVNLKSLGKQTGLGTFVSTSLIVALATSLPELFVGLTSALAGEPNLSLGNVIGANIANLSLVVGGAALLAGSISVHGEFVKKDIFYAFLAGASPMLLLFDKTLSRLDGLILIGLYIFYQTVVIRERRQTSLEDDDKKFTVRLFRRLGRRGTRRELGWIFLSFSVLLFSADMIVRLASNIAMSLGVPVLLIGLVIVSLGTTLPELIFDIEALKKHQPGMVFGNLLGSIVANGTLIIGLVALLSPVRIQGLGGYLLAIVSFILIFATFTFFVRSKHRLDRAEGVILIIFYFLFTLIEFGGGKF